ncbi:proliferating cell nuclear antigen, N-terminal domain-containing protein [Multifurca ochricompacta]|uniref:DNA sliding clamp PCNA n=1 Tax=Multifurca ochricompacta TaxID=376703 RepID=A0AAD4QJU6_9AGAM|nr:proliferating cell nuclear antigen, N-terminal domain-containing protein [Multifurca ochricompacta]
MLEATLNEAATLKRLLDAVKELVQDANFECNEEGINLQAMDNSHVALVSVKLHTEGFSSYRCDRPIPLGVNLGSLTKVLKCAKDDDKCTLKATDNGDILSLKYEAHHADRVAEYDMKLMDIDADSLGIPDTDYDARITMMATEFARIVRDLSTLGESVRIEVSKEGVRFLSDGEAAQGNILLKQTDSARARYEHYGKDDDDDDDDVKEEDDAEKPKKTKKVKKVKKEEGVEEDGDEEMANGDEAEAEFQARSGDEGEDEVSDSEKKKRKRPAASSSAKKKAKKAVESSSDSSGGSGGVHIEMSQHVSLTFSLKYLVNFSKSGSLSDTVQLMLKNDVPLLVSYTFGQGYIRYYLAPKIGDE